MLFSYRARQWWKRLFTVLLYIILALIVLACCLLLWLQRFLVYTPEGVRLDFDPTRPPAVGTVPTAPENSKVSIEYISPAEPEDTPDLPLPEENRLAGFYIEASALQEDDFTPIYDQLAALPAGTPVMMDVRSPYGNYYYSSSYGNVSTSYDAEKMDALIQYLADGDYYLIARFPALRDHAFATKHPLLGIQHVGSYVWQDSGGVYWIDPTKDSVMAHLIQVIKELRSLGFDEVVLQDFTIPESENIKFTKDRQEVLNTTAQALVTACANDRFTLSFVAHSSALQLPDGRSRLYLMNVPAAKVEELIKQYAVTNPKTELVIIADTFDTRYEICGTLHPLSQAH